MGKIEDLEKLQELKKNGILTDEELEIEKRKILNNDEVNGKIKNKGKTLKKIIIGILLISILGIIGVTIYKLNINSIGPADINNIDQQKDLINISLSQELSGEEIFQLMQKAIDKNKESKDNPIKIEIYMQDNKKTYDMETLYNGGKENFSNHYGKIRFKCSKLEYYQNTESISYILFNQIDSSHTDNENKNSENSTFNSNSSNSNYINKTKTYEYIFSTNGNAVLKNTSSSQADAYFKVRCEHCGQVQAIGYRSCSFAYSNYPDTKEYSEHCKTCNKWTKAKITCVRIEK